MIRLPILRAGVPYDSVDGTIVRHIKTGEPVARVSQANPGLISRDLLGAGTQREALAEIPFEEMLRICKDAARLFVEAELPVDPIQGTMQTPQQYVETLSATTGMPHALGHGNMEKIRYVMAEMPQVLGGLTRGLDLSVLDRGWTTQGEREVSYVPLADVLGVVLPSNSPGVHSLWVPSIALKVPLALKPGRQEPWTPMRIAQAFIAAGCPKQAFGFYPTDYNGATQIMLRSGRSMIFGDQSTVDRWKHDERVQCHGTGWSKVIVGEDEIERWERHVDLFARSIASNGGRSCLNASGVWVPSHGREIAEALARELATIEARPLDDPQAAIAAFSDPTVARRISEYIDQQLTIPGAVDMSTEVRGSERLVEVDGCSFLLPTVIYCSDPQHPLAATELLFPFAAVVETPQARMLETIGPTLVGTALTRDEQFIARLMACPAVDRLNLGPIPTSTISWDQPHEGNLFEHLYRQRAFQAKGDLRELTRVAAGQV